MKHRCKNMNFRLCLLFLPAICFLMTGVISAQTTVTLDGMISDDGGAALPGATVTAKNMETGYIHSGVSRLDGRYIISGLQPGQYECEVSLSGFRTEIRKGLTFAVGARLTVNFMLSPATLEEEVVVTAESPMVEVTKSEISSVVDREYIEDLPLLDRDWDSLSFIKAGAASSDYEGVTTAAQPRGSSEMMIDGISNEWTGTNIARLAVPADAIQEFRVITNQFAPEYGNASGLVRSAITRSGTNDLKGRVSFFYRDEAFDSANYFINHDSYDSPELPKDQWEKPPFKHLNYAGYLGGPIAKNKAHFFIAYDGFNRSEYVTITSPLVPKESVKTPTNIHRFMAKLNFQINEQNLITFRYNLDYNSYGNIGPGGLYTKSTAIDDVRTVHDFQANWTFYLSDKMMNEARLIYASTADEWGNPASPGEPFISRPSGYFGKMSNMPQSTYEKRLTLVDNLSIFVGSHSIKMGFELSRTPLHGDIELLKEGSFSFTTDAPFDPADFATYPITYVYNTSDTDFNSPYSNYGAFIQDSWRVSDRLTFNFGLRYSIYSVSGLDIAKWDIRNLNPRFGFSWDPIGDGKTSVRGGIGTYTQNPMGDAGLRVFLYRTWELRLLIFPGYPDPFAGNPFLPAIPGGITLEEHQPRENAIAPYTVQGTLGIQREIMKDISIGADLVYVKGYRMMRQEQLNGVIPGTSYIRPDMTRGDVWELADGGSTEYKALYLSFKKRYSHGWLLDVSYTLADSQANVETEYQTPLDNEPDIWDRMWGPTHNDARHRISAAGVVDLPWGFQLGGTFYYSSKLPWTAFYTQDINLDSTASDMVDDHRNARRGFDYFAVNFRVSKFINIHPLRLQLLAEVYNATNRTNFSGIKNKIDSPGFGDPQIAGDPRLFQLGIRVDF
ncbi:MAG: TonB-dependent receptor [Candidatus Aminicenantes bacterium]|nr:TonB-dependent receptor [Candidatus Aminicenantes bacterium]